MHMNLAMIKHKNKINAGLTRWPVTLHFSVFLHLIFFLCAEKPEFRFI